MKNDVKNLYKYGFLESRIILYIAVFIFYCSSILFSYDNVSHQSEVTAGLKGGYNYANFIGDDIKDYSPEYYQGLSFGVFLDIPAYSFFSVQIEMNYHEKGSDKLVEFIEFYDPGSNWSSDLYFKENVIYGYKLQYLELPIILKFHSMKFYNLNPILYCGIAASINDKAEIWVKDGGISENVSITEKEEDIEEDINRYDYNALFGVELGYEINRFNIFFDFRYNLGLVKIYDNEELDFKNSVFTTSIGFGYTLNSEGGSSNRIPRRGYK